MTLKEREERTGVVMLSEIEKIEKKIPQEIQSSQTLEELESVRTGYLGRKGILNSFFRGLKNLPESEKKKTGEKLNQLKEKIEKMLGEAASRLKNKRLGESLKDQAEDLTLPAFDFFLGKTHPLTQVLDKITEIFLSLGFSLASGPEIETDENNFACLNIPEDHPARDMHDTFYLADSRWQIADSKTTHQPSAISHQRLLLRTHTSPVQIRLMQNQSPPVRIIAPGKVYRHEAIDATHSSVFHQVEGLAVEEEISFADLKGTLESFVRRFFGKAIKTRFRPSYFPFVEPGAEMDISCTLCSTPTSSPPYKGGDRGGIACPVCRGKGWIEMLGAGMVHPNVFRAVGYDPEKVRGFAFGMGIERIAMIGYGIEDMRLFYENHLDFLGQF